ncbi:hypothetical protein HK098_003314 [Nowakowskiella sp. JEL0407]|nr:hypothetical protein HK098_003314 [Nowakowskiella sp. JEL0407]
MEIIKDEDSPPRSPTNPSDRAVPSLKTLQLPEIELYALDEIKTPISLLQIDSSGLIFPTQIWSDIFTHLNSRPQDLKQVAASCRVFRDICKSPVFRAGYFLNRSDKYLVFHHIYESFPWMLSFEVADSLLQLGSYLPKYFVERVYRDNQQLKSLSRPQRLPEGCVEFLIAQGYKFYKQELHLGLPGDDHDEGDEQDELGFSEDEFPTDDFLGGGDDADALRDESAATNGEKLFSHPPETFTKGMLGSDTSPRNGNDAVEFESCFFSKGEPNIELIKQLIEKHHYVPALACPSGALAWHDHWGRIVSVFKLDAKLALFLARHSGVEWPIVNESIVSRMLRDSTTTVESFSEILESGGFEITREAIVDILTSREFPLSTNARSEGGSIPALDILRKTVSLEFLLDAVEVALSKLFREAVPRSLREADYLMTEFNIQEDCVSRALLVNPSTIKCVRNLHPFRVPTMTVFAEAMADAAVVYNRANSNGVEPGVDDPDTNAMFSMFKKENNDEMHGGGIRDCLWQLIIGRYGGDHAFVQACLVDLLVGGVVPLANVRKNTWIHIPTVEERDKQSTTNLRKSVTNYSITSLRSSNSKTFSDLYPTSGQSTPPTVIFAQQSSQSPMISNTLTSDHIISLVEEDDEEEDMKDSISRDSLEALLEAGVPLEPPTFGPLSRAILGTRKVHARQLDFLARVERGLLGLDQLSKPAQTNSGSMSPSTSLSQLDFDADTSVDKRRWSKVRWVAAFRRNVLDDKEWKAKVRFKQIDEGEEDGFKNEGGGNGHIDLHDPSQPTRSPQIVVSSNFKPWYTALSETLGMNSTADEKKYIQVKRFYKCVEDLVTLLAAPPAVLNSVLFAARMQHQNQVAAAAAAGKSSSAARMLPPPVGPFSRWLAEVDKEKGVNGGGLGINTSTASANSTRDTLHLPGTPTTNGQGWSDWFSKISESAAGSIADVANSAASAIKRGTGQRRSQEFVGDFVEAETGIAVTLDRKSRRASKRMSAF